MCVVCSYSMQIVGSCTSSQLTQVAVSSSSDCIMERRKETWVKIPRHVRPCYPAPKPVTLGANKWYIRLFAVLFGLAGNGRLFPCVLCAGFPPPPPFAQEQNAREQEMWCSTDSGTCGAKSTDFTVDCAEHAPGEHCQSGSQDVRPLHWYWKSSGCAPTLMRIHKLVEPGDCSLH